MPSILLSIVIICLLAALIIYGFKPYDYGGKVKQLRQPGKREDRSKQPSDARWRSVKIRPGIAACGPVSRVAGQIFLAQGAPSLPLKDCSHRKCQCRYVFLEDRRSGEDRRLQLGRFGDVISNYRSERRHITGRRYADLAA